MAEHIKGPAAIGQHDFAEKLLEVGGVVEEAFHVTALRVAGQAGETLSGAHHVAAGLDPASAQALIESAAQAFDHGVLFTSGIAAVLSLIAAVMVVKIIKPAVK